VLDPPEARKVSFLARPKHPTCEHVDATHSMVDDAMQVQID